MENAKGEQFIRNGFERPGIDRLTRDPVLNKSVPFFVGDEGAGQDQWTMGQGYGVLGQRACGS